MTVGIKPVSLEYMLTGKKSEALPSVFSPVETTDDTSEYPNAIIEELATASFPKWNEMVGLPRHPSTLKHQDMTKAQLDFFSHIHDTDRTWIHLNKARQCGWTECSLRVLGYHGLHKYAGKKIGLVVGTSKVTMQQIFGRLTELIDPIPGLVVEKGSKDNLYRRLYNGTEYWGGAAAVETFTGWTKFAAFLLDESSKWNLVDDRPVLNATLPIARSNSSDLFVISTPKGPRGFFYHIARDTDSKFHKLKYDIWEGGSELYTRDQILEMLASSEEDPAQEYLCQFTIGRDSVWGPVTEDDRTDDYLEMNWDV